MKVGDYVRTTNGVVKIKEILSNAMIDEEDILHYGDFIKSSPNIIDLIEVGDYVNGFRVDKIEKDIDYITFGDEKITLASKFNYDKYTIMGEQIKSIVTKEQFESMEYKIGE